MTWPLVSGFSTLLGSTQADAAEVLWTVWWWHDSIGRGVSPFFCDVLRWPSGAPLSAESWNAVAALVLAPLWGQIPGVPEVALYNGLVLASIVFAGFTAYMLSREIWGGDFAAFLAGTLYAVGAYHLGRSAGHVDVVSMAASPLYFLALLRALRQRGPGAPVLAALVLALIMASSLFHFVFCCIGTLVVAGALVRSDPHALRSPTLLRRSLLGITLFVLLGSWFLLESVRGSYTLAPVAERTSTDLLSFFMPTQGSAWKREALVPAVETTSAGYLGFIVLALAAYSLKRAKAARPWLLLALVGFVLALGPRLRLGTSVFESVPLPFSWLERLVPFLPAGAPVRFAWMSVFGLAIAAAGVLADLVRTGTRGPALAAAIAVLAMVETWPHSTNAVRWPAPRFFRDMRRDVERWAVLDATSGSRDLWNQVLHRHPQTGVPPELAAVPPGTPSSYQLWNQGRMAPETVRALQDQNVRFIIVDQSGHQNPRVLGLPAVHEGDGLAVYEVPPRSVTRSSLTEAFGVPMLGKTRTR